MPVQLKRHILATLLSLSSVTCLAQTCEFKRVAHVPVSWSEGSMKPVIDGYINGAKVPMLVDTGASKTYVTYYTARQLGLPQADPSGHSYGIGGSNDIYDVIVNEFAVGPYATGGYISMLSDTGTSDSFGALVGADILMRWDVELWLAKKQIDFFYTKNCGDTFLGYWDKDAMEVPLIRFASDKRPFVTVELNGVKIDAVIDTGASKSYVTLKAAEKVGLKLGARLATPDSSTRGIGKDSVNTWHEKFNFKLGDEVIQNAPLSVIEKEFSIFDDASILLGQDWLRAHRVLFARSQMRMIYSYLGGEVFSSEDALPWYAKDAEAGAADAQFAMAQYYGQRKNTSASEEWLKKAAAQGNFSALVLLGRSSLAAAKYEDAEKYLQAGLKQQPNNTYVALWLYLAQYRSQGETSAAANLAKYDSSDEAYWPLALIRFYLGRGSADAVRADAKKFGQNTCMVESFIHQWQSAHTKEASSAPWSCQPG